MRQNDYWRLIQVAQTLLKIIVSFLYTFLLFRLYKQTKRKKRTCKMYDR